MAERRMFAKSIVLSDVFLDMPMSARCLYFTLGMLADDDGFVGSPRSIMRQCGASTDDLQILLAKRYVLGFESGVIVIKHWKINNYLQNDRHRDTTYLEELGTLTLDNKNAYTEKIKGQESDQCIQDGYILDTQDRLGKDRLGKVSIGNNTPPTPSLPEPDTKNNPNPTVDKTTAAYNGITAKDVISEWMSKFNSIGGLQKVRKATVKDEMSVSTILSHFSAEDINETFDKLSKSDFLRGYNNKNWSASFTWFIDLDNFTKVFNGNYDNRKGKKEVEKEKTSEETYGGMSKERYDAINKRNEELLAQIAEEERRNGTN